MKRLIIWTFSVFLLLVIISGCANQANYDNKVEIPEYESDQTAENSGSKEMTDRKVTKNADIDCSADDVSEKYQSILSWLKKNGGYEFSQSMTVHDEYKTINAVLKIAPEKLDDFIGFIDKNTEVINLKISSTDITEEYFDTQIRLKQKKAMLDRYYVMLEKAVSVDEMLLIQKDINALIEDIESMEGKLIFWDKQVNESTVILSVSQKDDPNKPEKQISVEAMSLGDMFTYAANGFVSVVNILLGILQWVLIIIISLLPLAVIGIAVLYTVKFILKKRKRKRENRNNTE